MEGRHPFKSLSIPFYRKEEKNPMNTLKIKYTCRADLVPAAEIIKQGGLVAFPTETVYGLGANALDGKAAEKIYRAKGRPSDNPLIVHLAFPWEAQRYCLTSRLFYRLAEVFMPGPLTVIMPKRACVPDTVTGGLDTVGIRIPSHPAAHDLIDLCGVPIAAPSANISGRPSPTAFRHVLNDLEGRVDAIIDGGESLFGVESTIIKLTDRDDTVQLLRPGAITVEMLSLICPNVTVDPAVTEKYDGAPLAPGMKYRHYAPSQPLTVLDGDDESVYAFLKGRKCGIICFDGDLPFVPGLATVSCGSREDGFRQAHRLFSCLRFFDGRDDVTEIYARMPARDGIGLAVFNRLIKASGFNVIKL